MSQSTTIQRPKLVLVQAALPASAPAFVPAPIPSPSTPALRARQLAYSQIIKSGAKVQTYQPQALTALSETAFPQQQQLVQELSQNLSALKALQGRLRFMISEVEQLAIQDDSSSSSPAR